MSWSCASRTRWNRSSAALAFAPMAGIVVDRTPRLALSRSSTPFSQWVVLVAVAVGLLFGAIACVAGIAGGGAHSAAQPSIVGFDEPPTAHPGHVDPRAESGPHSTPLGDHSDHSGSTSMAGSHPGMACVVSVDMHFPEPSSIAVSDSHETQPAAMSTGCPADVDPPVPRLS